MNSELSFDNPLSVATAFITLVIVALFYSVFSFSANRLTLKRLYAKMLIDALAIRRMRHKLRPPSEIRSV